MGPTTEEFVLEDQRYVATRLNAIDQFHLTRKIAPLVPPLAPLLVAVSENQRMTVKQAMSLIELAEPFAEALAGLSDKVAEQLFEMTLTSVKVETAPGTMMPLWVPGAKRAAKMELNDIGKLLPVVLRVIQFNLGPFIDGLLTNLGGHTPASNGEASPTAESGIGSR